MTAIRYKAPFLLICTGLLLQAAGCGGKDPDSARQARSSTAQTGPGASQTKPSPTAQRAPIEDKPLAVFQKDLLSLGFQAASAIPNDPHAYDRSRAQLSVVEVYLELDQPQRALDCLDEIKDWRRGEGYAELALYCTRHGCRQEVQPYLKLAARISDFEEDWCRDRVRVMLAKTYAALGNNAEANRLEKGVDPSESGKVVGSQAMTSDEASFQGQVAELDRLIASGHFDAMKNALESYTQFFNRFYSDANRRSLMEGKIRGSWNKLPPFIRIDLALAMSGSAIDHGDQSGALLWVNEAQGFMDSAQWQPEHSLPILARLATGRFRAGDAEKARADANAAWTMFQKEGHVKIVNVYRAGAIRPLAEAYQAMGETAAAISVYKCAVEEGMENPNSRPRAEDLCATCRSMALHRVEPDTALWNRIHQINQGLGPPW